MSGTADLLVLGLGAVGSATLLAAARRGLRVVGLERHGRAHDRGSSHGRSRITRQAYFEHPDYVPLLRAARAGFERLEAEAEVRLVEPCGVLLIGAPESEVIAGSQRAAMEHGIEVERLGAEALRGRFPAFRVERRDVGLFEPAAGFVRPEAAILAMLAQAEALGAVAHEHVSVEGWEEGEGVRAWGPEGEWRARRLVVAAGAWTPVLVPALSPLLEVSRQVQAWAALEGGGEGLPCWLVDRPGRRHLYGLPPDPLAGDGLAKVAEHGSEVRTTAEGLDRAVGEGELRALEDRLREQVPGLRGPVVEGKVCMYTSTPDGHFIVDRVPGCRHSWLAAGLSGHGFKLAPALGEALVDLALDGRTRLPVGFLGLGRLGGGGSGT